MPASQAFALRRTLDDRLDGRATAAAVAAIAAASTLLGIAAYSVWALFDAVLGRSLVAQIIAMGAAGAAARAAFASCRLALAVARAPLRNGRAPAGRSPTASPLT